MAHCWIYPKVLCPSKQFVDISCDCNWWSSKFTCSRKAPWACRFAFGICSICPWFQRPRHGKLYQVVHSLHTSKIWLLFFQSRVSEYLYVFVYIYIYIYTYIYIYIYTYIYIYIWLYLYFLVWWTTVPLHWCILAAKSQYRVLWVADRSCWPCEFKSDNPSRSFSVLLCHISQS